ncbi:PIG-L deacetylase family protein [Chitinophaga niabensis]|uniref:N-acetylglucosaminyl deacetylase, LmbE family n=1 Tax=Chitinophaga niabensis TaxID=536979 RepID=A0A1N6K2B9_9BACT|nr:PIG-L family deacetylase [Chitinophaga niabensis]SIO50661.1 N-acetylglucosaminyl deacetylase, LmbE family [Chitinophaga niabensis]
MMNILCVAAHPDDIEILCAGTLVRYAQEGHKITFAVFTSGNMGDTFIPPEELGKIREKETREAAAIIGAKLIWGGVMDEHVFPDQQQRHLMIDILREADPDVIFTHSPNDYHPDHRYVSQLVFDSYFQKGLPFIPNQSKPACRFGQAQLYYMDNLGGIGFIPSEYVDISKVFSIKQQMLACHKSQVQAMQQLADTNLAEMVEVQARFRGLAAGCRYAEGFTRLDAYQRGLTKRVLP